MMNLSIVRKQKLKITVYAAACVGILLTLMVIGYSGKQAETEHSLDDAVAELTDLSPVERGHLEKKTAVEEQGAMELAKTHQAVVGKGETLGDILRPWLTMPEILGLNAACEGVYSFSRMRAGQPYTVVTDGEDRLVRFEYEPDREAKVIVSRADEGESGKWKVEKVDIVYDIQLSEVKGEIRSNLFNSVEEIGENAFLAIMMADIFAWEIDFIRSVQQGDSFRLLVEKRWRDGEFRGYGNIVAAEFTNVGTTYDAFLFPDSQGRNRYFTSAGESLNRAFLKAPLEFKRISSSYNMKRLHPILKTVRAHPAIDYAASTGTPILAIGDAIVAEKSTSSGNGNYIVLRHGNGYTSMYLHMSRFEKGISKGGTVRQGDVIGYVGSTGLATGPHLCFRMRQNGASVDPGKLLSPREESIDKKEMDRFFIQRDLLKEFFTDGTA